MSTFRWSSPSRRVGAHNLEPVPLEVYLEIFGYFNENENMTAKEARQNLANLALVCRFFSSVALPRIFEKMEFSGSPRAHDDMTPTTSRFCRAVINNQEPARSLAQYVRKCNFSSWQVPKCNNDSVTRSRQAFLSMYRKALAKMRGVEMIYFNNVSIDKCFFTAMKKLQNLHSLHFSKCVFAQGPNLDVIKTFAQELNLKALTIFQCGPGHAFHSAFTSVFNFQCLKSLEVDNWIIVQHLARRKDPLSLETMTIHDVEDLHVLPALFQNMPELSTLHIYRIDVDQEQELSSLKFPATALPKLHFIDCPPALASLLIPSRPIAKVCLMGTLMSPVHDMYASSSLPALDHQFLKAMQSSATIIEEAIIPKHLYTIDSPKNYMPGVSTLKISWFHANWANDMYIPFNPRDIKTVLRDMFGKWPPNPSIRRMVLDFGCIADCNPAYLDLQCQNDILRTTIVDAFPLIEQVNFLTCINWTRSLPDGRWRAHVPKARRKYLALMWLPIRHELVDYEGCFDAVFSINGLECSCLPS